LRQAAASESTGTQKNRASRGNLAHTARLGQVNHRIIRFPGGTAETDMTLLEALKADHDKARDLLADILDAADAGTRRKLFAEFAAALTAHSRAEESVLYARLMKSEEGKDAALEGTVDHQIVDRLIADLTAQPDTRADEWTARCVVLQELLEHHIEEEESEVFETAGKLFDAEALDRMGDELAAEKSRHDVTMAAPTAA
jgi:hemerythrin superfamily protein